MSNDSRTGHLSRQLMMVIALVSALLVALMPQGAAFAQEPDATDEDYWTPQEQEAAIAQDPSLAGKLSTGASASGATESTLPKLEEARIEQLTGFNAAACKTVSAWFERSTALGAFAYRFTQNLNFCWDGVNVVSVPQRFPTFEGNGFEFYRGLVADSISPVPAPSASSTMQATVENCVPNVGCISSENPRVDIAVNADGTWTYNATSSG